MNIEDILRTEARKHRASHISLYYRSIYRFSKDAKDYGWKRAEIGFDGNLITCDGEIEWYNCFGLPASAEVV